MFTRLATRTVTIGVAAALLSQPFAAADAAIDPDAAAVSGRTESSAAGSCWEIKQKHPSAPSARYWIITPAMPAPMQIYCDQNTDGGGWELVARGRDRWVESGGGTPGSGDWMTGLPIDGRPSSNGAATMIAKQLPGSQIDALLNHTRVDALSDGIRLRRAKNSNGTAWQEVRVKYTRRDRWTWALAAKHAVRSYSIDGTSTGASQQVRDLRISGRDDANRIFTFAWSGNNYVRGFTYGLSGPVGSSKSTSYLYSTRIDGKYATPFTQMYIRPRLSRDSMGFATISDSGKPAVTNRAIASSQALPNAWGVKGLGAGGTDYNATEVSAFAQIGNTMYVGGNFTKVRNNVTRVEYSQPYLAAFDATTGAWVSGFRPRLNNQVKALAVLNGRLAVGGQFSQVNGKKRRILAVLDPKSGATYRPFTTDFRQTTGGAKLWVRSMAVSGRYLYVGGGFTQVKGGNRTRLVARHNLTRLRGTDGAPYPWAPNLGIGLPDDTGKTSVSSSVLSLSLAPHGSTIYAAGLFTRGYVGADGRAAVATPGAAAITTGGTANFRAWSLRYSTTVKKRKYQQAVKAVGTSVWLGGSQHSMVKYAASNLAYQRGNITLVGGDVQAIATANNVVYGSCHCNDWNYSDTLAYDKAAVTGFTQADRIGYVGAWDATTGDYLPQFAPTSGTRSGEGPFALQVAANGTLWSGGDYTSIVTTHDKSEWAGGFVRFPATPSTAPAAPKNLAARRTADGNGASFTWTASTTAGVSYELLKDNRVIQTSGPGDTSSDAQNYRLAAHPSRFFVRAVDAAGNRSATTPVVKIGGPSSAARLRAAPDAAVAAAPVDLITAGSAWTITAPGARGIDATWASPRYVPTSSWKQATTPIGWGSSRLTTSFDDRPDTLYLRRDFSVDDPSSVSIVTIRTLAHDGTAIYVNGVEVGRENLPSGPLTGAVLATATPHGADSLDRTINVPTSLLVRGRNVISAEVHPGSASTTDVAFELEMSAE